MPSLERWNVEINTVGVSVCRVVSRFDIVKKAIENDWTVLSMEPIEKWIIKTVIADCKKLKLNGKIKSIVVKPM